MRNSLIWRSLILVAFASGCDRESTELAATWLSELPEVELPTEPMLAVGGLRQHFVRVEDAQIAGDSVLVIVDGGTLAIWSFSLDGTEATSWGRDGQGPGEFRSIEGGLSADGQLWVWDAGQMRVSRFDLGGVLLDDFPLWSAFQATGDLAGPDRSDCLWFTRASLDSAAVLANGYARSRITARCVDRHTTSEASVFPGTEFVSGWERESPPMAVPWSRTTLLAVAGGDLWATPNDSLSLSSVEPDGALTTLASLPALGEMVPQEVVDRLAARVRSQLTEHLTRGPEQIYPDLRGWWGDGDGGAWLATERYAVRLDRGGEPRAKVRWPDHRVLAFDGRYAITIRQGRSWGASVVEVWELALPQWRVRRPTTEVPRRLTERSP